MNGKKKKNNRNENNCHVFHFENETGNETDKSLSQMMQQSAGNKTVAPADGKKDLYDMFFVYLAPEQEIIFGHGTRKHY